MFGLTIKPRPWNFAVFGKHPAAGDFITLGDSSPLLLGFSSWMDQGFSRLSGESKLRKGFCWRFWARGPNSKLILGLVKSSQDCHGRIYPLMVVGEGKNPEDMDANWDLFPLYCEKTWMDLYRYTGKRISAVKDLKRTLGKIKGPLSSIRDHHEKREAIRAIELSHQRRRTGYSSEFMNRMNNVEGLSRMDMFSIRIDVGQRGDCHVPVMKLLALLKNRTKKEPGTVFIGGRGNNNRMLVLKRSLLADDFARLWAAMDEED